jgi:ATP-binding protein involved in chromosome partitioning
MLEKSRIEKALKALSHPRTGENLMESGVVQSVVFEGGEALVTLSIDAADAAIMTPVRAQAEEAVAAVRGVKTARVMLTAERAPGSEPAPAQPTPQLHKPSGAPARAQPKPSRPAPPTPDPVPNVSHVIAVASGKGGVGKSTTSVNLAVALSQQGLSIGLVDCDIYGPSIAHMLGLEGRAQVNDEKQIRPHFAHGLATMTMGLLMDTEQAAVWRGPMVMKATQQLLMEVDWGERGPLDALIVDLPPGTGDVQLTLAQTATLTGAVIVSTPQDLALIDARKAKDMFDKVKAPVLGVIENMSYFACPKCGERTNLFGHGGAREAAEKAGLDFLGEIPLQMAIREAGDSGVPVGIAAPENKEAQAYAAVAEKLAVKLG